LIWGAFDSVVIFDEKYLRHLLNCYQRDTQRVGRCSPCRSCVGSTINTFEFEYPARTEI
jgi:hypothetical protein